MKITKCFPLIILFLFTVHWLLLLMFGRSVNPIPIWGGQIMPPDYYWHPQIFSATSITITNDSRPESATDEKVLFLEQFTPKNCSSVIFLLKNSQK